MRISGGVIRENSRGGAKSNMIQMCMVLFSIYTVKMPYYVSARIWFLKIRPGNTQVLKIELHISSPVTRDQVIYFHFPIQTLSMTEFNNKVVVQAPSTEGCSFDSVIQVYTNCIPPQGHNIGSQQCWGIMAFIFPGSAGGCCCGLCYGCDKADCCTQCWGSWLMSVTSECIIGWYISCVVGCQMVGIDATKFKPSKAAK